MPSICSRQLLGPSSGFVYLTLLIIPSLLEEERMNRNDQLISWLPQKGPIMMMSFVVPGMEQKWFRSLSKQQKSPFISLLPSPLALSLLSINGGGEEIPLQPVQDIRKVKRQSTPAKGRILAHIACSRSLRREVIYLGWRNWLLTQGGCALRS